jgi:hypothetical protein
MKKKIVLISLILVTIFLSGCSNKRAGCNARMSAYLKYVPLEGGGFYQFKDGYSEVKNYETKQDAFDACMK